MSDQSDEGIEDEKPSSYQASGREIGQKYFKKGKGKMLKVDKEEQRPRTRRVHGGEEIVGPKGG